MFFSFFFFFKLYVIGDCLKIRLAHDAKIIYKGDRKWMPRGVSLFFEILSEISFS